MKALLGMFLIGCVLFIGIKLFGAIILALLGLVALLWPVLVVLFWIAVIVALIKWIIRIAND